MKIKFCIILLIFTSINIYSQVNLDPTHRVYKDILIWESKGYLQNLSDLKPYPLPYLKKLLKKVETVGTISEAKKATEYLLLCENKIGFTFDTDIYLNSVDKGFLTAPLISARGMLTENISVAVKGGSYFTTDEKDISTLPEFQNRGADYNTDTSNVGPLELMSTWESVASIGNEKYWLQAGLSRNSFGQTYGDSVVMNQNSPQSAYITLNMDFGNVMFNKGINQVAATDLMGEGRYPNKFISYHSIKWQALSWLNIGFIESVTFGERFDLLYILPFTQLMYSQGVNGFIDNSMIGVTGEIKFPKDFTLRGIFFVDDFDFNGFMKLDLDSKYKFALQTDLTWAPSTTILRDVKLGYTVLTPHMYTHEPYTIRGDNHQNIYDYTNEDHINYSNYTNQGESIGSTLLPNSDRIELTSTMSLPFGIDLDLFGRFIRNANSNDDMPDEFHDKPIVWLNDTEYFIDENDDGIWNNDEPKFLGDGSLNDHGVLIRDYTPKDDVDQLDQWRYLWEDSLPLLNQDEINYTVQAGLKLSKNWFFKITDVTLSLDYTYQNHIGVSDNFITLNCLLEF